MLMMVYDNHVPPHQSSANNKKNRKMEELQNHASEK